MIYPDCLDMSEASSVLVVERELYPGPILVDATAITDDVRRALDTRFGPGAQAASDPSLVPALLAAGWQWIVLATMAVVLLVRRASRASRAPAPCT